MNIYVGHATALDYQRSLYRPLKNSELVDEHTVVLPHEDGDTPFDSKEFLRDECDLFVADVSCPSTGLGIELGWADVYDVSVLCVHQMETTPSRSLSAVTDDILEYKDEKEFIELVCDEIRNGDRL